MKTDEMPGFVDIEVKSDGKRVTLVLIKADGEIVATGSAVKSREDKFDLATGQMMALGRALQLWGKNLERRSWGYCKHQDDMRERKKKLDGLKVYFDNGDVLMGQAAIDYIRGIKEAKGGKGL